MDLASSSSSSFFRFKPEWIHDVFINFWGEEISRNFVSHLHSALLESEVKTFLDYNGMQQEELTRAIEGSQIAIVVFNKSFTESGWCLEVLTKIIECHQSCGPKVMSLFYEIDPSTVRHQTGDFGKALKATAKKIFPEKNLESGLLRWSRALTKAANLPGWTDRFRNDAKLVDEIVDYVLVNLDYGLSITRFPVGLECHVEKVVGIIKNQPPKVCIIGIWGMGGSGKTTVAKAIYNRIHRSFMCKSFIADIRESCQTDTRGNVHLQEQLLSDLLKTKVVIHSVKMGIDMIKKRLGGKIALIVLDDVNEFGQLGDLCRNREWFSYGTVIIITTRDVHLLKHLQVDYVYKMEEMDEIESLEFFSWHAFGEAKPREDFNELARNVVAYCGGLPLALQVLGSCLFAQPKKDWESLLSELKITPNDDVQEKLRISFDDITDTMEKDIFLDICCFFVGKDRAYVTKILEGCGLHADIGIHTLIDRSLIKLEKNNKLGMHPLLQEMGKEMIRENLRKEPGKHSRLCFHEDVVEVLTKKTGTNAVEGLVLKLDLTKRHDFQAHAFKGMMKLRLLRLDYVQLTGDYQFLPKELRWIYWKGFPLKYMPENFYLRHVIAIELKHSNLRQVWKQPQVLLCLKILNLSHSKYLTETPDFSNLPNLEKLIFKDCPSLHKVHESIGDLSNLLLVNLKDCTSLSYLPREIYKSKSLKTLILYGCSKIHKLEENIVHMESLTTLIVENTNLEQVPFSVASSKSIGYISLCRYAVEDVFPCIILPWMSSTIDTQSCIHLFSSMSSSLVPIHTKNEDLGDLAPIFSILSNLRSFLVQCDTEFELSALLATILDDAYGINITQLEITSDTSQISKHYLKSYLIGMGSYQEVFNNLSDSIPKELAISESSDISLPGDNHPYWLAHMGEGHSVYFIVPEDCHMKGIILCVVYLSISEKTATECLTSVLMVNYTKCTIQICKRDTVNSFNDVDWEGIMSHVESGDKLGIFVIFGHKLVVKKTAVYLICDKSIDRRTVASPQTKNEPKKNAFVRFTKKFVTSKTQEQ